MGTPKWSEGGAPQVGVGKSKMNKLIKHQVHITCDRNSSAESKSPLTNEN